MTGLSILVLTGTDHHPFTRAVRWAESWVARHPDSDVYVQHGFSEAPMLVRGDAFVDQHTLRRMLRHADIVICHGGPGSVTDARTAGHRPIVLPRDPERGEHVDDHQQRFAAWAADKGLIEACGDVTELDRAVSLAAQRSGTRMAAADRRSEAVHAAVRRFSDLLAAAPKPGQPSPGAPTVVYIGGLGRSGSTLLERLLGEVDGVTCLGEVVHLWRRGVLRNELCGCGAAFHSCSFWTAVGEKVNGSWTERHATSVLRLHDAVDRQRHLPLTMLPWTTRGARMRLAEYASAYSSIYSAAQSLTGANVLVDSSKHASLAFALTHSTQIDLRVIHIVRDPVAVAHSWSKSVRRPEAAHHSGQDSGPDGEMMAQFGPVRTSALWTSNNLFLQLLRRRKVPVTRVRYEDVARHPQQTLARAWADLSLPGTPELPMTGHHTVKLNPIHSVAGNPMRFSTGELVVERDDAWRTEMPRSEQRLVAALTWPMRAWYGYPGGRHD